MILLDTNALIWSTQQPERLSRRAHDLITASAQKGTPAVAASSLYEIAWGVARRRIRMDRLPEVYLQFVERSFNVLPITVPIAMQAAMFGSKYPRDPSDRLIGATAVVHGLILVTADEAIRASGEVACVW